MLLKRLPICKVEDVLHLLDKNVDSFSVFVIHGNLLEKMLSATLKIRIQILSETLINANIRQEAFYFRVCRGVVAH